MGVTVQYSLIFFFEYFIDHNWTNLDQKWGKYRNSENMLKLFSWKLFRITQTNFKNYNQN